MTVARRQFIAGLLGGTGAVFTPAVLARESARARVVVVGGGVGGATAAKYVSIWSRGKVDVTLVEPSRSFVTCVHSNFVIRGLKSLGSITFGYDDLRRRYGVRVLHRRAARIDTGARTVGLDDGGIVRYDALVLSPGISLNYDSVPGWGRDAEELMPHGWRAGRQTLLLKRKLEAVPDGGLVILLAPPNPYRCPPAPYERVSLMARALLNSGRKRCKIIVLDPKPKFADQALFQEGWESIYPGMIEWINAGIYETIERVEPATNTVVTGFETYKDAALVNVIPAQAAADIARTAGLADATGFCPVEASTMRSRLDANTFIVGDSCDAGPMPKSASGAHCQAKVAAAAICEVLTGRQRSTTELRSTCFSAIDDDYAVRTSATYAVDDGRLRAVAETVSGTGESARLRRLTQAENMMWYARLFADVFR